MVDSANTQGGEESTKTGRKRPRIDMAPEAGQRKRGKSMFALALGTLTKAKNEDRQRGQSDAAKKRQEIEQRLQDKLRKETDSVRRAEEAKKDKTASNRKEEELQLKDSIYKLRRTRLPLLANFLLTSDNIPDIPLTDPPSLPEPPQDPDNTNLAAATARASKAPAAGGPAPLTSSTTVLPPSHPHSCARGVPQAEKRRAAAEAEWSAFAAERSAGITEIARLRERVVEEASRSKGSKPQEDVELSDATAAPSSPEKPAEESKPETEALKGASVGSAAQDGANPVKDDAEDAKMEVDDEAAKEGERREKPAPPPPADEDDAVEY
ncbi:hypothetical protein EVJ58_g4554 [Rhodofomes roseus]|uniref:Pinin/SDK/MemA protein domain-containing protein n=1 Tax=Rhodofomes roseus TaxID=34475 RepID=A0A4Y9YH95_9APHY|nr:hypothetical protein EVJ58_g4554 [Rhodofomes roseus]